MAGRVSLMIQTSYQYSYLFTT